MNILTYALSKHRNIFKQRHDEEWDKNDNKNVADSDDTHILVK